MHRERRRADEASRDVEAWLKCKYMRDHLGEEFSGVVSSVTSFGIFVTLDQMYVEGLVHITELGGEYFRFDEARQELRGERSGMRFAIGTPVQVQVSRVDLDGRRIDFRLITEGETAPPKGSKERRGGRGHANNAEHSRPAPAPAPQAHQAQQVQQVQQARKAAPSEDSATEHRSGGGAQRQKAALFSGKTVPQASTSADGAELDIGTRSAPAPSRPASPEKSKAKAKAKAKAKGSGKAASTSKKTNAKPKGEAGKGAGAAKSGGGRKPRSS